MHTAVTLGFTVAEATSELKAIVLQFPDEFRQDLDGNTNVIMNLNREFPVAAANEWADDSDKRMLRLFLDDTEESTVVLPGEYQWKFPVIVPKIQNYPEVNIWHISLCTSKNCFSYSDPAAAVVFPIAGFAPNQKHQDYIHTGDAAFAAPSALLAAVVAIFVV
jgi:hypothetical protein